MGLLQVGPDSSGADPGPVCYGLGGVEPTVTDADLALGYLDENYFLGGTMKLNKAAAQQAIEQKIAKPLGVTPLEATWGIHDLINEIMAGAAKTHIAEKGGNPKVVTVCAFGGAGPVHAYGLAKKMGAPKFIVPPLAGVGSALGFFTAPRAFDLVRSHKVSLQSADFVEIEKLFKEMENEGTNVFQRAGGTEQITFARSIDMRFVGQGSETNVPLPDKNFSQLSREFVRELFDQRYQSLYGRTYPESSAEFVSFKVRASLPQRLLSLPKKEKQGGSLGECLKGERLAFSPFKKNFVPFKVYDRYRLFPGARFSGPAIIEERESTVIVGEDSQVSMDDYGFLWIQFSEV